ncbi:MAG TPA: right-handed parallel beta-helix repeat-containing protein [Planctomycetota bacterium]|jgi:hypothetical protein
MISRLCAIIFACCAFSAAAVENGTPFDLQGFIDSAIKSGKTRVEVPKGRYRVTPKQGTHLTFKDLTDITIIADDVELICTQTSRAIGFQKCRNVRVKGLTIDYDPLAMTQGRITALAPDKSWIEFEIIEGYPENKLAQRIEIYDPATGELRRTDAGWEDTFESTGNHRYRAAKRKGYRFRQEYDTEQVGDILVTINQSPNNAGGHAITSDECAGVKLEDITLYNSPCFGFVEHRCDGNTYVRCKIDRRSPKDDPIQRAFPRMRSLTADAFHSTEALRGPSIIECTAKFMGDDAVNIHGSYHFVTASNGSVLRMGVAHRLSIEPGDPVEFLPYNGPKPPDAVAKSIEPDGPITDDEKAFLRKLNMNPGNKERLLSGQAKFYKLTLDRTVPLAMGAMVCSANRMGNGFVVKDCDFGFNRSRGILIKASRGEVSGNKITRSWMAAVLVSPEYWWSESGSSCDLVLRDNRITGCRLPAIEVVAPGGDGKPLPSGTHKNIQIVENTLKDCAWPNIRVTSTSGLVIKSNKLTPSDPEVFTPPLARRWEWRNAAPSAITTENCEGAEVQRQ